MIIMRVRAFLAVIAFAAPARADSAADALFVEGKKLLADGHAVEACQKLERSHHLAPAIGVRFHLARCHERIGRTYSAWLGYLDVANEAHVKNQTAREKAARGHAAALEPKLSRLVIDVETASSAGLVVKRNGLTLDRAEYGIAQPVDPGGITVEATAPGMQRFETVVEVVAGAPPLTVHVPELEPDERERPTTTAAHVTRAGQTSGTRTAAVALGVGGAVALGVGTFFGIQALSKNAASKPHCEGNVCDDDGAALRDSAVSSGHASTVSLALGTALIGAGVCLWFFWPGSDVEVRTGVGNVQVRTTW
jgi:hypothetical protein